jgi:hypothetical protein
MDNDVIDNDVIDNDVIDRMRLNCLSEKSCVSLDETTFSSGCYGSPRTATCHPETPRYR